MISTEKVALDITEGKLVSEGNLGDSVPTRRSSMRKIKEVLRLRFELGLGQREIARACSISQGAVHNYLKKEAGAGMQWPLPEGWDRARTSAEKSPGASGVDALAHGELGRADRTAHGPVIRTDPGGEAASGDGLSILKNSLDQQPLTEGPPPP